MARHDIRLHLRHHPCQEPEIEHKAEHDERQCEPRRGERLGGKRGDRPLPSAVLLAARDVLSHGEPRKVSVQRENLLAATVMRFVKNIMLSYITQHLARQCHITNTPQVEPLHFQERCGYLLTVFHVSF